MPSICQKCGTINTEYSGCWKCELQQKLKKPAITVKQNKKKKYNKAYNLLKSFHCFKSDTLWCASDGYPLGYNVYEASKSLSNLKGLNSKKKMKIKNIDTPSINNEKEDEVYSWEDYGTEQ